MSQRKVTFRKLAALEPGLDSLLAEARSYHRTAGQTPNFCANAVWYGYPGHEPGLKRRLMQFVGHVRGGDGVLATSEAYDVAYHTIYQALPDCRHEYGFCQSFRPRRTTPTPGGELIVARMSDL